MLSIPSDGQAQELWHGFSYGDDNEKILKQFPNAKIENNNSSKEKTKKTKSEDYVVEGFGKNPCALNVLFHFSTDAPGLYAVYVSTPLTMASGSQVERDACAKKIINELIDKYGPPDSYGYYAQKDNKIAVWNRKNNVFIEWHYIDFLGVRVIYSKEKPPQITPFKNTKDAL